MALLRAAERLDPFFAADLPRLAVFRLDFPVDRRALPDRRAVPDRRALFLADRFADFFAPFLADFLEDFFEDLLADFRAALDFFAAFLRGRVVLARGAAGSSKSSKDDGVEV